MMIYTIWEHTRSISRISSIYSIMYMCTLAFTGVIQLIRIMYRNVAIGRNLAQFYLQRHGETARITLFLPRPWKVRAGERLILGVPWVGIFYLFQGHPFTIAWWEEDDAGRTTSVSLLFRPRTGFTKRLLERVEANKEYRAWIDGPFGPSTVHSLGISSRMGDYGHILMVATGIGVAAQLPYIKEILEGHRRAQVCTQRISLVWELDGVGDWESAHGWLQQLVAQDDGYVSPQKDNWSLILKTTNNMQLLHVTVYDTLKPSASSNPKRFGHHDLIEVHGGSARWDEQLSFEMKRQTGTLLVSGKNASTFE